MKIIENHEEQIFRVILKYKTVIRSRSLQQLMSPCGKKTAKTQKSREKHAEHASEKRAAVKNNVYRKLYR